MLCKNKILVLFLVIFCWSGVAFAAPTEVCQNGVDDDGVGGDATCPSPDIDGDGYTTDGTGFYSEVDPDDTASSGSRIFPGVYVPDSDAGCAVGQWKLTGNGSLGTCTSTCPAAGGSTHCWDIRSAGGSDSNSGHGYANGYATLGKLFADGGSAVSCGDYIFIWKGVHANMTTIHVSPWEGVGVYLKNKSCPTNPINVILFGTLTLPTNSTTFGTPIAIDNVNGINILGGPSALITDNYVTGPTALAESGAISLRNGVDNVHVSNIEIKNTRGYDNFGGFYWNEAGSMVATGEVDHMRIWDSINNGGGNPVNNSLVMGFYGKWNFHHNSFGYRNGNTVNAGIRVKHADCNSVFTEQYDSFSNVQGIVSAAKTNTIHHNRVGTLTVGNAHTCNSDKAAFFEKCDSGGPACKGASSVYNNTVSEGGGVVWWDNEASGTIGIQDIHDNVWQDNVSNYGTVLGIMSVANYSSDTEYNTIIAGGYWNEHADCIWNLGAAAVKFCFLCGSPATTGSLYDYPGYTAAGFCSGCVNENPALTAGTQVATSTNCATKGWSIQPAGSGTTTTTTTTTSTSTTTTITGTTTTTTLAPQNITGGNYPFEHRGRAHLGKHRKHRR